MTNLCVLFGGKSAEYEVSLRSAASVIDAVDPEKYDLLTVGITKTGRWYLYTGRRDAIPTDEWKDRKADLLPAYFLPDRDDPYLYAGGKKHKVDVVFPVMHGATGEDGRLQGLPQLREIPSVGSGCPSSALCMDKHFTKSVLAPLSVPMAKWLTVRSPALESEKEAIRLAAGKEIGYPLFVKPANAGSSVGVTKVKKEEALFPALFAAAKIDRKILIEEAIDGREIEVAVLGNGERAKALACGEVIPGAEFYDYDEKYNNGKAGLAVPADLTPAEKETALALARKVFAALDCRGLARVDFFLSKKRGFLFNEINTMPGFTSISLYPRLAACAVLPFGDLVGRLV